MSSKERTVVLGTGMAVPDNVVTNADLEKVLDTSDQWIVERSGIRQRRYCEENENLTDLAVKAAATALADAGVDAGQIGLVLIGTVSGPLLTPSAACVVQRELCLHNAVAFDLSAACSGFLYSLHVADSLLATVNYKYALVIGGDHVSSFVDHNDRETAVLFGDGAGAVVLKREESERGIVGTSIQSDGSKIQHLYANKVFPGVLKAEYVQMNGREVFRSAGAAMAGSLKDLLSANGFTTDDLDLVIPHQANIRIVQSVAKQCGLPMEKFFVNLDKYGNTSAGTIPIALHEARKAGVVKGGDLVGFAAFGAGFAWASAVIRF